MQNQRTRFPKQVHWLLAGALVLVLVAGISYALNELTDSRYFLLFKISAVINVSDEHNIPTWYSSMLWVVLGGLGILGAFMTRRVAGWLIFAAVCVLASLDEYAMLHETLHGLGSIIQDMIGTDLLFSWVLPGIVLALIIAAVLLPLIWNFPTPQRNLLFVSAALFLFGAVVFESISGQIIAHFDNQITWHYTLVALLEESAEMFGVGIAIGAVAGLYEWRLDEGNLEIEFLGWQQDCKPEADPTAKELADTTAA